MKSKKVFKKPYKKKGLASKKWVDRKFSKLEAKDELLHKDVYIQGAISNAGSLTLLNGISQGDSSTTRTGNDITTTSLQFRGHVVSDADLLGPTKVRAIVVVDKQCNGAAPTMNSILDVGIITDPLYAPYARESQRRFKIKYDKTFTINPALATSATVAVAHDLHFKKKIRLSRLVKYGNTGGNVTDITTNSIYFLLVSNQSVLANEPSVEIGTRLYFKD